MFEFEVPNKLIPFMQTRKMYQILYGGRSSSKTYTALIKLLLRALEKPNQTILCTREYQSSIKTSTYAELKKLIWSKRLEKLFTIKADSIICHNGTEFIFKGLAKDIAQIKSIPNISVCFVEEAETIGRDLWDTLDPTLRAEGCELIVVFNPRERLSATYQMWIDEERNPDHILRIEINYDENPFNSPLILEKIEHMKTHDYARYEHIYLGKVLDMSEDVIFKGKFKILDPKIEKEKAWWAYNGKSIGMLWGMDFGFSVDPAAMLQVCFLDKETIYIHKELYKTKIFPEDYLKEIEDIFGTEGINSKWMADCSRPDTIAQLKRYGLNCEGAKKGKGSVESGIEWLLGKSIIINPECKNMIFEAYNYRYKIDKNSETITREIVDKHNHAWDALRYALSKQITATDRRPYKIKKSVIGQFNLSHSRLGMR